MMEIQQFLLKPSLATEASVSSTFKCFMYRLWVLLRKEFKEIGSIVGSLGPTRYDVAVGFWLKNDYGLSAISADTQDNS